MHPKRIQETNTHLKFKSSPLKIYPPNRKGSSSKPPWLSRASCYLCGCNHSIKQINNKKKISNLLGFIDDNFFGCSKPPMGVFWAKEKIHQNTSVIRWWVGEKNPEVGLREWNGSTTSCSGKPDDFIWAGQLTEGWANGWLVGCLVGWLVGMGKPEAIWWDVFFFCFGGFLREWSKFDEIEIWGAYSSWEIFKNDKLF